jgi:hypothetical protein
MKKLMKKTFDRAKEVFDIELEKLFNKEGGGVRAGKERLAVNTVKTIIERAAKVAGLDESSLFIEEKGTMRFKCKEEDIENYINKVNTVTTYDMLNNSEKYFDKVEMDLAVYYNCELIMVVESKAYMETTMFKKFIYEVRTIQSFLPSVKFVAFQLENGIGGDYHEYKNRHEMLGSKKAHAMMCNNGVYIEMVTLLDGKRCSKTPIHKKMFTKTINEEKFEAAVLTFAEFLEEQTAPKTKDYRVHMLSENLQINKKDLTSIN